MSTFTLTALFALAVAGVTVAATSVRFVSRIWLRHWVEQQISGDADQAMPALDRPRRYLLAAGTGIAAMTFALGAVIAYREDRSDILRHLLIAAALLLTVGQILPRVLANRWGTKIVPVLIPLLQLLDALFGPILRLAARAVRPLLASGAEAAAAEPTDPLEDLLREAEAEGIGEAGESEIISGVVEFGAKRVREVMTPRERMTFVTTAMRSAELSRAVAGSQFTRIPVFGATDDELVGVLHAFDVLVHPDEPLLALRAAAVAASDEPCGVVMRRMLRDHRHLAVVRDGTHIAGIVTLEDLVEELVGDIHDEHDEPEVRT